MNKKYDTNLQTLTLKNAMGIKVDELDIEIANYVEESLEKIKKHKVYGKWIKTNKKLKRGESEEWYEINELVDDVWWGAIKKFDCEKEMVAPQDKDGNSTGYEGTDDTERGNKFFWELTDEVEGLFNWVDEQNNL